MSKWLSPNAVRGIVKAGDLLVPGNQRLPSFSASGLIKDADRMLAYMTESDRSGLVALAQVLRILPKWAIQMLLWLAARGDRFPDFLGSMLRQVDVGLKGFVYTMYYSDPSIRKRLGWDTHIQRGKP